MTYDYQSAINSGVTPETIANFLAKQQGFDVQGAVNAGANIKDVMVFLSSKAQQDPATKAPTPPAPVDNTPKVGLSDVLGINTPSNKIPIETAKAYAGSVGNAFKSGIDTVKSGYEQSKQGADTGNLLSLFEGAVKMGAGAFGSIFSPLAPVSDVIGAGVNKTADVVSNIPAVQDFAQTKTGQNVARGAEDIANLSGVVGGVAGVMDLAPKVANLAKDTYTKVTTPSPVDEVKIIDKYNRAIKPTVVGKGNAGQIEQANTQVVSGLKTIAENKDNLKLTDMNGETITGETPKTLDQLTQAIAQTKKTIFEQYDALAKQAGDVGVNVDTTAIASELSPIIDSKSLSIANPSAVTYAEKLQQRLMQTGSVDATTAQEVIQHYNESLKAFYKNPSYETASNVQIDALIANKFRTALDNGISDLTGEQYGALKKQYGSLASMEKDVAHRNVVFGRQNEVGLMGNLANISSGAEVIRGILTLDPKSVAIGTGIKGIQLWMKYLNNPDKAIANIFTELSKPSALLNDTGMKSLLKDANIPEPKTGTQSINDANAILAKGKATLQEKVGNPITSALPIVTSLKDLASIAQKNGYDFNKITTEVNTALKKAEPAKVYLDKTSKKTLSGIKDSIQIPADIKKFDRTMEKTILESKGNVSDIKDLARNTIIPTSKKSMVQITSKMKSRTDVVREKIQTPEKFMGYNGIIYNIKTPNGLIVETQVVSPEMIYGKFSASSAENFLGKKLFDNIKSVTGEEAGVGHLIYEKFIGLTPSEKVGEKGLELIKKSTDYYGNLRNSYSLDKGV